jgi:23S rRNA (cytosine1962-C5)-methyltransferase
VCDKEAAKILDGSGQDAALLTGEMAHVESSRKEALGRALVNPNSGILARIREAINRGLDAGFGLGRESARIVFADADFLPGLRAA